MKVKALSVGPIVGYTTETSVRVWGRGELRGAPHAPERCHGLVRLRQKGSRRFGPAKVFKLLPHFDFTGTATFRGLRPATTYEVQIGCLHSPAEPEELLAQGSLRWSEASTAEVTTAPASQGEAISFVFGSCRYILRLLGGAWWDQRGDKTFRSILGQVDAGARTDLLLLVGDQIYADMGGLRPDRQADEFFARYRKAFGMEHLGRLMSRLPTYMTLDDHEIQNNWSQDLFNQHSDLYAAAIQAYQSYQMVHGPAYVPAEGTPTKHWYRFDHGCAAFFVTDTRTERFVRFPEPQMLGEEQMAALKAWLLEASERVKLVVSSVPLFPDPKGEDKRADKWAGFSRQRTEILDLIRDHQLSPVVFLSGDIHCSLSAELECSDDPAFRVISVVSSSLFWPYPQGQASAFELAGTVATSGPSEYRLRRVGPVYSQDNFTRVDVTPSRIVVRVYGRKGSLLGEESFPF